MSSENQQKKWTIKGEAPWVYLGKLLIAVTFVVGLVFLMVMGAWLLIDKAVSGYGRGDDGHRIASAQTQIASFSTALDAFEVDNGYFPQSPNGLQDLVTQPSNASTWHGPYLKQIPQDPWRHDYVYQYPGQHNTNAYDLSSMGPNGRAGDKDDITNWKRS